MFGDIAPEMLSGLTVMLVLIAACMWLAIKIASGPFL